MEGVESAKYEIQFLSTFTPVLGRFFTDPDPDFRPIRTQEKNSDPDPDKRTGSETLVNLDSQIIIFCFFFRLNISSLKFTPTVPNVSR